MNTLRARRRIWPLMVGAALIVLATGCNEKDGQDLAGGDDSNGAIRSASAPPLPAAQEAAASDTDVEPVFEAVAPPPVEPETVTISEVFDNASEILGNENAQKRNDLKGGNGDGGAKRRNADTGGNKGGDKKDKNKT